MRRIALAYGAGIATPLAVQWAVYRWLLHVWERNGNMNDVFPES